MTSHLVVTSGWAHAPCLPPVILDGRNLYKDPRPMEEPGFGYRCVGPTVQKVRAPWTTELFRTLPLFGTTTDGGVDIGWHGPVTLGRF